MSEEPIIIWWGVNTSVDGFEEGIRAEEPISILKKFLVEYAGKDDHSAIMSHCPAIVDELTNVYGVKPYYDYKLSIDSKNDIGTSDYDQKFFDQHILIRSERQISFATKHIFFAPYEKSLEISQISPFMEDNTVANSTIMVPGKFDIGKYFRTMDCSLIFKKKVTSIRFLREQVFYYVRFHTTRPIVFQQFYWDKAINEYTNLIHAMNPHKKALHNPKDTILSYYYKLFHKFQFKKKLIKIIEKNLTI
tara:strand:- start:23 stop:766 length:744 start_codon:yes stop_codon:yes gene_type:complete